MQFRHHNQLRVFTTVAKIGNISQAANELNLTKGAVSQQIRLLEDTLGFSLFERLPRGVALSTKGRELLASAEEGYATIENKIKRIQQDDSRTLTIGVSTYFASRWLSSRLMDFLQQHPEIRLRIQPMVEFANLPNHGIDMAVRWGAGQWDDVDCSLLFKCPAWPSGNSTIRDRFVEEGLEQALKKTTLLHDSEDSKAWQEWFSAAEISYHHPVKTLIIPDPNVRVQAVVDGQGIALNDALIDDEIESGQLHRLSSVELDTYGYHVVWTKGTNPSIDVQAFSNWLVDLAFMKQGTK